VREAEFREWLQANGANSEAGRNSRVHAVKTIERKLAELGSPFTTLDEAWSHDRFEHLRERIRQTRQNARAGGLDFRILMPESKEPLNRLASWNSWLAQYGRFLGGEQHGELKDADRIRQYALEHYIEPAREEGRDSVEILVSDVNHALDLNQAWPNICQALAGKMFQDLAEVPPPERIGADQSSATRFRFRLSDSALDWAEAELRRRYSEPIATTSKMMSFEVADGRQVALDRETARTQIWLEGSGFEGNAIKAAARVYSANENRHHHLPQRLRHDPPQPMKPQVVTRFIVDSSESLRSLLDAYDKGGSAINREVLEHLRERFVAQFPDFRNFAETYSGFHRQEDDYKRALIERVETAIASHAGDDEALGRAVLDLVLDRSTNLIGNWRTYDHLIAVRKSNARVLDRAAGVLARSNDQPGRAAETFLQATWSLISAGQESNMPYGDSRILPSLILALARPSDAIALRYQPFNNASLMLLGRAAFANAPLSARENEDMIALARAIEDIMRNEWGWKPRDLWDVQGFIWVTCQQRLTQEELDTRQVQLTGEPSVQTTNLILFGPPGTGKTFRTAEEALKLCGEQVPQGRNELMTAYRRLTDAGRIEFVTFHQSYAYEEFVEGLRPVQGEEDSAGFHLHPEPGVLRRVARRAETSTGSGGPPFKIGDRQIFKMSIGRANDPEDAYLFEEAIERDHAMIGFDDLDWSDPRFESRDEIIGRLKAEGNREGEISPYAGRVQSPDIFRNWMRTGDLVVVSKGNLLFRAIGEVIGDYEYEPRSDGTYSHRRAVKWLWIDRAGVPVEEIYSAKFSQRTIYLLTKSELNIPALERYIESQREGGGEPDQFVLIIDEINRANVSKVMGELITLLEPDKRIGATNELRVRLPYSRDIFGLPPNLHIIGTMNTADRSIALLDTALRRRFKFKEVPPEPKLLEDAEEATGLPLVDFLNAINDRIEYLLDREHRIGHAYFINCRASTEVDAAMRNAIIPLLQEYFFEDLSRVAIVLGEPKGGGFLACRELEDPLGDGDVRLSWQVRSDFASDSYERCIKPALPVQLVEPPAEAAE
jgi:hypothetical protein